MLTLRTGFPGVDIAIKGINEDVDFFGGVERYNEFYNNYRASSSALGQKIHILFLLSKESRKRRDEARFNTGEIYQGQINRYKERTQALLKELLPKEE